MAENANIIDMLRTVIRDELKPINDRLDRLEQGQIQILRRLQKDVTTIKTQRLRAPWVPPKSTGSEFTYRRADAPTAAGRWSMAGCGLPAVRFRRTCHRNRSRGDLTKNT